MSEEAILTGRHSKPWRRRWAVIAVVLLGLLLRLWAAWQLPQDFDEPVYLEAAFDYADMLQRGNFSSFIDYSFNTEHPPLVKLIYGAGVLMLGPGVDWEQALHLSRAISVIFGTLSVFLVALLDPLAGGMLAVQTMVVKYTSQAYLEAFPLFTSLAAIFCMRHSRSRRDRWFWLSALALGLTAAGKYSYFPVLFVVLYLAVVEKRYKLSDILLYAGVAVITFWAFDPALWRDPLNRLYDSIVYHAQYAVGEHVQEVDYPWYKPLTWVSRSNAYTWHPDVFFYLGFDGLIFISALTGLWLALKRQRWTLAWLVVGMVFLLIWPTKWPQYSLVALPAFCLVAAPALRWIFHNLKEQDAYWDWLQTMFPRPNRKAILIAGIFIAILLLAGVVNAAWVAFQQIGWSSIVIQQTPLPSNTVYDLLPLGDGRMLIATDYGVAIWRAAAGDEVQDEWVVLTPQNSGLPHRRVLAAALDQHGVLWLGTAAGLARYDGQEWQIHQAQDFGLGHSQVNALAFGSDGSLWIGTPAGAAILQGGHWTPYTTENSDLESNAVFSLAVDARSSGDRVWFGTLLGVSSFDTLSGEWRSYPLEGFETGLGGVADLLVDSSGRLWVATLGGGIRIWDEGVWSALNTGNSELPYNMVQEIYEQEPGMFWIGVATPNFTGGLLARYDEGHWVIYQPGRSGFSGGEVLAIAQDAAGRLWFGTRTQGIDVFERR